MNEPLLDDDGENRAVRAFLLGRELNITSIESMCAHMYLSGFDGYWPEWAATQTGHLTKAGAQSWLRYLFGREAAGEAANAAP